MIWSYGITTVPERATTLLPDTITSLAQAGFDQPLLFVDGYLDWPDLEVVTHPRVGQLRNWLGALHYLFSTTRADRYAIFEDDVLALPNLRAYLDQTPLQHRYLNLLTHDENRTLTGDVPGWHASNQLGRGAAGLVFEQRAAELLLRDETLLNYSHRGGKMSDAAVVAAMRNLGYREMIHYPSLLQHVGLESVIGHSYGGVSAFLPDFELAQIEVPAPTISTRCLLIPCGDYMLCNNVGCNRRVKIIDPTLPAEKYKTGPCRSAIGHRNREPCPHLGDPEDEPALILCESCLGRVRIKYPAHTCALHERCLPTYRGAAQAGLTQCHSCPDNPRNIRSADAPLIEEIRQSHAPTPTSQGQVGAG